MTENNTLDALADHAHQQTIGSSTADGLAAIRRAVQDAYDLGTSASEQPAAPRLTLAEERTAFGQAANPAKREGFVLNAVNTIKPEQITEHGEDALLAWIRQTLRELAANGADPMKDATIQIVGMDDGTVVVTGEAGV